MPTRRPPGPGVRLVVGVIGSSIAVAAPLWNWYAARILAEDPATLGAQPIVTGTAIALGFAWLLSVILTWYEEEPDIKGCVLSSIGLPGTIISLSIVFQGVK